MELEDFANFVELPKKDQTHRKVQTPGKRGFSPPGQPHFINGA